MSAAREALATFAASSLHRLVPNEVTELAKQLCRRHGAGVVAVLAYGSCLRDTALTDSLIDYYVLADTSRTISPNGISRLLCRWVPPNVYYFETEIGGTRCRAKYAVLMLDQFERRVSSSCGNPYFWARFSQPCALVYFRDDAARSRIVAAVADAICTMLENVAPELPNGADATEVWIDGLRQTYSTELRSEGPDRARQIVEADSDYYCSVWKLWAAAGGQPRAIHWGPRRVAGKVLSVLRLCKAAFTFNGGADYLAWKIARHSGETVTVTDWQRRHPILAAVVLLPRLLKSGAVR